MTFIWRGIGILVPIVFFAIAAVASIWIEDRTLGNSAYVGWTSLGAAVILLIIGLTTLPGTTTDTNTGALVPKKKHDFFFVPIIVWALIFGGVSVYMFLAAGPSVHSKNRLTYKDITGPRNDARTVHFFNPSADTLRYVYVNTDLQVGEGWVLPGETKDVKLPVGLYQFVVYDQEGNEFYAKKPSQPNAADTSRYATYTDADGTVKALRSVKGSTISYNDYDEAWLLMDQSYSMMLVDVTELCNTKEKSDDKVAKTDWHEKIYGEYNGDDMIEPYIKGEEKDAMHTMTYFTIITPSKPLPNRLNENESCYMLITYKTGDKPSSELIAQQIISAGFK